jgi:thioredoxin 1
MAMKKIAGKELQGVASAKGRHALVDFSASWCGPCRMLHPVLEQLSAELAGWDFYEVDIDEAGTEANSLGIRSVPTLIVFSEGKEIDRLVGFRDKAQLKSHLEGISRSSAK